jgi:hypothetical protein
MVVGGSLSDFSLGASYANKAIQLLADNSARRDVCFGPKADVYSRASNAHAPMASDTSRIANVKKSRGNTPARARGTNTTGLKANRSMMEATMNCRVPERPPKRYSHPITTIVSLPLTLAGHVDGRCPHLADTKTVLENVCF